MIEREEESMTETPDVDTETELRRETWARCANPHCPAQARVLVRGDHCTACTSAQRREREDIRLRRIVERGR